MSTKAPRQCITCTSFETEMTLVPIERVPPERDAQPVLDKQLLPMCAACRKQFALRSGR